MTFAELVTSIGRRLLHRGEGGRWPPLVVTAALVVSGCGQSGTRTSSATTTVPPATTVPHVPSRDTFIGPLRNGTGALAGAQDVLEVRLQPAGATGGRRLTLWILTAGCRAGALCVHPSGRLSGRLVPVPALPDVGRRYAITASGSVHPVGAVAAVGMVGGTGNSRFGHETLELILRGKRGSGRLTALSGRVPGFTSP